MSDTRSRSQSLALGILRAAWGEDFAHAVWHGWTDAEREHAGRTVQPLLEPIEKYVHELQNIIDSRPQT